MYMERAQVLTTEDGAYLSDALATLDEAIKRIGSIVTLENAALEVELRQKRFDAALARVDKASAKLPARIRGLRAGVTFWFRPDAWTKPKRLTDRPWMQSKSCRHASVNFRRRKKWKGSLKSCWTKLPI